MDEDFAELERMAEAAITQDAELEDLDDTTSRYQIDTTQAPANREYLVKLEGPINSANALRDIARLPTIPKIIQTQSEDDESPAQFCRINGTAKNNIVEWLLQNIVQTSSFRPTFIPINRAPKDFDPGSAAPTLGLDTTMPQNRPHYTRDTTPWRPLQEEYPVWYFFYGTLASSETLKRLFSELDEDEEYVLHPARVRGGRLTTTRDNAYKALVDDDGLYPAEPIPGHAFLVKTEGHEDALRYYETNLYEVVRCRIEFEEESRGVVEGCTFRFRG